MEMNKRNSKKVIIGLWISVVLNMLFVGVFIGQRLHMVHFISSHKNVYNRLMQKDEIEAFHKKMEQSEKEIEKAMLKEPYDKQAVLDALKAFDAQTQEIRTAFHAKIAEEAANLPPEERLKLIPGKFKHKGFMGSRN
jgi:hypothetical protein